MRTQEQIARDAALYDWVCANGGGKTRYVKDQVAKDLGIDEKHDWRICAMSGCRETGYHYPRGMTIAEAAEFICLAVDGFDYADAVVIDEDRDPLDAEMWCISPDGMYTRDLSNDGGAE